jgi:Ca-activated chloride channel family protein
MKLQTSLLNPVVAYDSSQQTSLILEFTAPKAVTEKARPPIAVVACMDVSPSMAGEKLENVKKSLLTLLDFLTEKDYFGLVSFHSFAKADLDIAPANAVNKEHAKNLIKQMQMGGGTNLGAGLATSFDLVAKADLAPDCLTRIIALTDGMLNTGIKDADGIADLIASAKSRAKVSAFGYGVDADQVLMAAVAAAGEGSFTYMDKAAEAAEAFGKELGGLLLTTAVDIEVEVSAKGDNQVLGVVSILKSKKAGKALKIKLPNMIDGQTLNVVLDVKLAKQGQHIPRPVNVFEVKCSYRGFEGEVAVPKELDTQKVKASFVKNKVAVLDIQDKRLAEIVLQQESARAIQNAQDAAEKFKDYNKSQDILNKFATRAFVWGFPQIQQVIVGLLPMYSPWGYSANTVMFANSVSNSSSGSVGSYTTQVGNFADYSNLVMGSSNTGGGVLRAFTQKYSKTAAGK